MSLWGECAWEQVIWLYIAYKCTCSGNGSHMTPNRSIVTQCFVHTYRRKCHYNMVKVWNIPTLDLPPCKVVILTENPITTPSFLLHIWLWQYKEYILYSHHASHISSIHVPGALQAHNHCPVHVRTCKCTGSFIIHNIQTHSYHLHSCTHNARLSTIPLWA